MSEVTLLPCPFCGKEATLRKRPRIAIPGMTYWVGCKTPNCPGDPVWEKVEIDAAVKTWNRRSALSQEAVRDEALEEALRRSPCERLLLQGEFAHVASNCEPCTCWRSALKREPNAPSGFDATASGVKR